MLSYRKLIEFLFKKMHCMLLYSFSGNENKGSLDKDFINFCATATSCFTPLTASHTEPSAPATPPAATISAFAPVKQKMASISVKTSPTTGIRRGPWAPGELSFIAISSRSVLTLFSKPTGMIKRTRRPITALKDANMVPPCG